MADRSPSTEPVPQATATAGPASSVGSWQVAQSWTGAQRRRVIIGVLSVIVALGCSSIVIAAVIPVLSTPDEVSHVDYGYQVWHGNLPVFEDGVVFRPPGVKLPPVHLESQHPPLFYLIIAPVVGPLIDAGHWRIADLAGRAVNVAIAIACVLALAWAGSLVARRRRWAWAIAVPAMAAPITPFGRVGGTVFSDNLTTLLTILALGLAIQIIRRGPTRWSMALAALVCAAGSLTRGNFVATIIVLTIALPVGVLLNPQATPRGRIWKSLGAAALPFGAALVAGGWFYLRNIRMTGRWTGGHPEWFIANLNRREHTLSELWNNPGFWWTQLNLLKRTKDPELIQLGRSLLLVTAFIGLAAGAFWLARSRRPSPARPPVDGPRLLGIEIKQLAVAAVLAAQAIAAEALQIVYAMTSGAILDRYLLPALLPMGALLAAGVLAFGRQLAGAAFLIYASIAWGFFLNWAWLELTKDGDGWSGSTANGIPHAPLWIALALLCLAVLTTAVSLTDWTSRPAPALAPAPEPEPEVDPEPASVGAATAALPSVQRDPEHAPSPPP